MCGFVGIIDQLGSPVETIAQMTEALAHRGPNDSGILVSNGAGTPFVDGAVTPGGLDQRYKVALGFRRLSILDLSPNGHQPMQSADGRYAIVFNGEVYNYREYREELIQRGFVFRSNTDTETVLNLYIQYGSQMLDKLNGMFAFAIYDRVTDQLFLARDRLGIKPLYYYQRGSLFLFGSEVKAFWRHPLFESTLDARRLDEYLLFRYVAGENTLLSGVKSVPGGTTMIFKNGALILKKKYWVVPTHQPEPVSFDEARGQLEELLKSSVKYQLISDVKVGCQLSGGVDSSLVSDYASQWHGGNFDSVSIIFQQKEHSEEVHIDGVNNLLGLTGHKTTLGLDSMFANLERATWHFDFPLSQPNSLGILLLAREAKKHVTVLLSGEGADEVFGGYDRYHVASWLNRLRYVPGCSRSKWWRKKTSGLPDFASALICLSAVVSPDEIRQVYGAFHSGAALEWRRQKFMEIPDQSMLERFLTYDQETYLIELLVRQDKMCMAEGIENRVPFLDHRIVEFAKTLPTQFKISSPLWPRRRQASRYTKRLLKEMAAVRFGADFAYRSKAGFSLPLAEFFADKRFAVLWEECRPELEGLGAFEQLQSRAIPLGLKWSLLGLALWLKMLKQNKGKKIMGITPPSPLLN